MNNFIPQFPSATTGRPTPTQLPDDKIIDRLEFGVPNSWQKAMVLQDFNPMTHTVQEFVAFCEGMEQVEIAKGKMTPSCPQMDNKTTLPSKVKKTSDKHKQTTPESGGLDCHLHGENCSHVMHDCHMLIHQSKQMKQTYKAQHLAQKKAYKNRQELHALIAEAVKAKLNKNSSSRGSKCKQCSNKKDKEEELNRFENLLLPDDSSRNNQSMSDIDDEQST